MTMLLMPDLTPFISSTTYGGEHREPASTIPGSSLARSASHGPLPTDDRREAEELIDTVKSSLWGLLETPAISGPGDLTPVDQDRGRSTVIQGAAALERLQTNLAQAFEARDRLEHDIEEARHALETMRAELAGTRAGERQARHLAAHDQLTGLANRGHFQERLCHALAMHALSGQSLAVMYIDLDGFKPINDTYGHAAGDALLQIVANRLTHAVRARDLVSRLGGDEFACLIEGIEPPEQALGLAMKLREAMRAPCKIGHHLVTVDASIGVVVDVAGAGDSSDLLLKADMAMYRAKRECTGIAFYDA